MHRCRYQHLGVISAISKKGKLFWQHNTGNFDGNAIVEFLKALLKFSRKKIIVIWDGALIHRCAAVKAFLTTKEGQKVWLERIPPYSPELNADEQVWNYLKSVQLKNVSANNLTELEDSVCQAMTTLENNTAVIRSFFKHPDVKFN